MKWFSLLFILTSSQAAFSQSEFNLVELEKEQRGWVKDLGAATAAMVPGHRLSYSSERGYEAHYETLKDKGYCKDFSLSKQVSLSECTGTLISDRHILTAGHCADLKDMCRRYKWVFDYQLNPFGRIPSTFLDHQVYACKKITYSVNVKSDLGLVGRLYKTFFRTDFAIIELDRPVIGRTPVKISSQEQIESGTKVFTISYPLGMPAKVSTNGEVVDGMNTSSYFWTTLKVFQGSSGGPIFDEETGALVGVISKGISTTATDNKNHCLYERQPEEVNTSGQINANAQMKKILEVIQEKKLPVALN